MHGHNACMTIATALIPARLGSTRLPGKVLLAESGKALILHVCERARAAKTVKRVVVATDAEQIAHVVRAAGFEAVMTSPAHANGTSRLAEAAAVLGLGDRELVVNVQGDEPEVEAGTIDACVNAVEVAGPLASPAWMPWRPVGTVAVPLGEGVEAGTASVVKVVCARLAPEAQVMRAMYFSRAAVPFDRDGQGASAPARPLHHVGVYAYEVGLLKRYVATPATPLERTEQLEQLRILEHGHPIAVALRSTARPGIDTRADYEAFLRRAAAAG